MATHNSLNSSESTKPSPSELAKNFVKQYYSLLNRETSRIHCFYDRDSIMIHGQEAELDAKECHGPKEISERIMSLELEDCKVFITNLDCQPSANNGYVVFTMGEIALKNGTVRRFVQTFFLATQAVGFYVLNDIFRYIREEADVEEPTVAPQPQSSYTAPIQKPAPEPQSAPEIVQKPAAAVAPPAARVVETPAPPATWATMASGTNEKWAGEVSTVRGTVAAASIEPKSTPKKEFYRYDNSDRQSTVFVKNITRELSKESINQAFSKFGEVKDVSVNFSKSNAVVEFFNMDAVKKCLLESSLIIDKVTVSVEKKKSNRHAGERFDREKGDNERRPPSKSTRSVKPDQDH